MICNIELITDAAVPSCPRTTVLSCQELGDPLLQPFHSSNRAQRDSVQRLMQPFALRTNSAGADICVWHAVLPGAKCLSECTWQHGMVVMINRIILAGSSLRPRQTGWRWWQKPKDVCATCHDAHTHDPASQFEARAQTQSKLRESNTRT